MAEEKERNDKVAQELEILINLGSYNRQYFANLSQTLTGRSPIGMNIVDNMRYLPNYLKLGQIYYLTGCKLSVSEPICQFDLKVVQIAESEYWSDGKCRYFMVQCKKAPSVWLVTKFEPSE
jgi:hypothetical protein